MVETSRWDRDDDCVGLRIIIVSDIRLYRDGLARALSQLEDVSDVATCGAAIDCVVLAQRFRPNVIVLDMSSASSASSARLFARELVSTKVVAIAVRETEPHVLACVEAGATGYVSREGSLDDLVAAIRRSSRGEALCSPAITGGLMRRVAMLARNQDVTRHLTARELEIAEHIALGMSNRGIAARLGIELCTVKNHVHNILEKLGVDRRSDVAGYLHN